MRRHGYTLMEVLIALGIFAIGFVAVAAMFPAAAWLQKETIQDVDRKDFMRSMESVLSVHPAEADFFPSLAAKDGQVHLINAALGANDRSPGTALSPPTAGSLPLQTVEQRPIHADIFARWDAGAGTWFFYVLMIDHIRGDPVPTSSNTAVTVGSSTTLNVTTPMPGALEPGDWIIDNLGSVYVVDELSPAGDVITIDGMVMNSPTSIYYGPADRVKYIKPVVRN